MGCDSSKETQVLANHTNADGTNEEENHRVDSNGSKPDAAEGMFTY